MIIASWWPGLGSSTWLAKKARQVKRPSNASVDPARPERPNYYLIHGKPLPLDVYPLPPFTPHNPLSLIHVAAVYVWHLAIRASSHSKAPYQAYWSSETRSVHVTDEATIRALWEKGFFGKGNLSRSEPTWLEREKKRLGIVAKDTSEEYTRQRREERKQFKNERARKEREAIEESLMNERGSALDSSLISGHQPPHDNIVAEQHPTTAAPTRTEDSGPEASLAEEAADLAILSPQATHDSAGSTIDDETLLPTSLVNQEHLQLTSEEAFFLKYGLGALEVYPPPNTNTKNPSPLSTTELLILFRTHSYFPPAPAAALSPSDPFLISYVAYHHFRSLGWVVRSGIKFGVDYLLYNRGPAFAHAQFSVVIIPSYAHEAWKARKVAGSAKSWWWLHAVNRVQSQVLKNLVICFVEVPPPTEEEEHGAVEDITALLARYRVREMMMKRWTPNRTRD